ncbi:Probable glycosyltransferase At5g03795 [Linum perenne]
MDKGVQYLCQAEAGKLLLLVGAAFVLVMAVQYFEIPSIGAFSSLFLGNATTLNGLATTGSNVVSENASAARKAMPPVENGTFNGLSSTSSTNSASAARKAMPPIENGTFNGLSSTTSTNSVSPSTSPSLNISSNTKDASGGVHKDVNSVLLNNNSSSVAVNSSTTSTHRAKPAKKRKYKPPSKVVPISEMNYLLQQRYASSPSVIPKWSSEVDKEMLRARSEIEKAVVMRDDDPDLYAPIYRNVSMFKRSYELMESLLKVYVYPDGEKPIFHEYILEGIYASEGWFMKLMENNQHFVTKDPSKAHLFYIPFSSRHLELKLYVRKSHSRVNLVEYMKNFVDMLGEKYPFWNRTDGTDHFVAACHDWAPAETRGRMLKCIRALCNSDLEVGFSIGKDVSLPETYVRSAKNPLKNLEVNLPPSSQRKILAFFAGNVHGYVRPILLDHWENKDPEMRITGPMPHVKGGRNYIEMMKNSKFCICPRGFEVNSPRIVESIFFECVPVIISDNFVPPFFEVLEWESFAVFVLEKDIPNLKKILVSISDERYAEMHKRVKMLQKHFLWHHQPVKYDLFHMLLHSFWYNRVFQMRPS